MIEKLKARLLDDGYVITDQTPTEIHLSRPTKVGAPINKATGLKIDVFVEINLLEEKVDYIVEAHNGDSWCEASLKGLGIEYAIRHMKTLEKRVVYAWRELTD